MNYRDLIKTSIATTLSLAASLAMASGSDGGGSAETGDTAAYNAGKSIYATKLACGSCPMAGQRLDAAAARALLAKPSPATLSAAEAQALQVYLTRRFKL